MPLQKIQFKPGFNKQQTATGAEGQWIEGDNIRFRYGEPQKIGGWQQLNAYTLAGPVREQLTWTALDGKKYAALGTSKILAIYYEGTFYDITPLQVAVTGCTYSSTTGSTTVTITKTSHGLLTGDYLIFSAATTPGLPTTSYNSASFTTNTFEVQSVPTPNTFTIKMATSETGTGVTTGGTLSFQAYEIIGPVVQTGAFGWGTGNWGSYVGGPGWGQESSSTTVVLAPGSWSLDNYGQVLVATIKNGKTFTWDPSIALRLQTRATVVTNAPTASIMTLVSDRDRHLFAFGTETTIGDPTTQDPMFIRFSNQEDINTWNPTVTNTAGTFRLDTGNEIIGAVQGKDYILVLTDQAAYTIQFVGPPFTFSIRQVGTNCGCIGQHALVYAQGAVFWMGFGGGFFAFDGTVKQIPSLVEDFVFTNIGDNLGINYDASQITYAYHNSLYNEVGWNYAKYGSTQVDRNVIYNFVENTWTVGTLARTTYKDAGTYALPYATQYNRTGTPTFPTINGVTNTYGSSKYWQHETGVNEVSASGVSTAIAAYVKSGDYDISEQGLAGDGQLIMRVKRFIPDFKSLEGNAKITLYFRDYPADADSTPSSTPPLITGPFTITSSTTKVDTRVRGRQVSLKIENDAVGETWRYGTLRLDIEAGGRR
jgi:hypothetical protein